MNQGGQPIPPLNRPISDLILQSLHGHRNCVDSDATPCTLSVMIDDRVTNLEDMMKKKLCIASILFALLAPVVANAYRPGNWTYSMWPYSYDQPTASWMYFNEGDSQWCVDLSSGSWSQLASSSLSS